MAKPISTTCFSFGPSICYVISCSKEMNFLPIAAIGLKFRGWVAGTKWTLTVPHIGGQIHRGCVVEGGGARAPPTTIPCYISKKAGSIEYVQILHAGSLTLRHMFCTLQVRIATAHAHNIFLLYLCIKTVKKSTFCLWQLSG